MNEDEPMGSIVSVIIPFYNEEQYLARCLSSVCGQSWRELEILLLDDGSTDGSAAICEKFCKRDSRIVYIRRGNQGIGTARNLGISAAAGEYVTFVDGDDWLEKDFVRAILEPMERSGADIGLCDINYWDGQRNAKEVSRLRFRQAAVSFQRDRSVVNKARTFAWGKIYRRALFHPELLYPPFVFEDIAVTPLLVCSARLLVHTALPLYNYWRNQPGSLSSDPARIGDMGRSLALLRQRFTDIGIDRAAGPELKKMMLGQLRFAMTRWGDTDEKAVCDALDALNEIVRPYYRVEKPFREIWFGVGPEPFLREAAAHVAVSRDQLVPLTEQADYYISFLPPKGENWIRVPEEFACTLDRELAGWEIAERIMEEM